MTIHARTARPPLGLSKTQKDLLVAISGSRCAWRVRNGWRPKGQTHGFQLTSGDALIREGLAMTQAGRGPLRLVATGAGEAIAREIKYHRQQRRRDL